MMATKRTRAEDLRGGVQAAQEGHHKLRGRGAEGSDDQRAQRGRNAFDWEEKIKLTTEVWWSGNHVDTNTFHRICLIWNRDSAYSR